MSHLSPTKIATALGLALLLLVAAGYFAFHALFEKRLETTTGPFTGPAALDPYYVLARYLEARGLTVDSAHNFPQPLPDDSVVLWLDGTRPVPESLLAWAELGGQLWTTTDPFVATENGPFWESSPWPGDDIVTYFDEGAEGLDDVESDEETETEETEGTDAHSLRAARIAYGQGCLTLVGASALRNDVVLDAPIPAQVNGLLDCNGRPQHALIIGHLDDLPPAWLLLVQRAPAALVSLALLLVLLMLRAGSHLGPLRRPPAPERRRLIEHIRAVGALSERTGVAPLVDGARSELRHRLRAHVPDGERLEGEALAQAVSAALRVPPEIATRALITAPDNNVRNTLQIARAIQQLWRKT